MKCFVFSCYGSSCFPWKITPAVSFLLFIRKPAAVNTEQTGNLNNIKKQLPFILLIPDGTLKTSVFMSYGKISYRIKAKAVVPQRIPLSHNGFFPPICLSSTGSMRRFVFCRRRNPHRFRAVLSIPHVFPAERSVHGQ